jgi:hypothetical protein
MKHAVEISSGAMIYIPILINISSGVPNLIGEGSQTQTALRSHKPTFIF